MDFEDELRQGNLNDLLTSLQQQIRGNPADSKLRVFLFQLLAVMGQWDRSLTQLNVCADLDASTLSMVQTYREMLSAEVFRQQVFTGIRTPLLFGKPKEWVAPLLESLKLLGLRPEDAIKLRDQAFDLAPAVTGTISIGDEKERSFEWIADADPRLGPMFEAVINGNYYWIPLESVKEVRFESPEDLRDLVWTPVYFTWSNGGEAVGLMPTRYPGSEISEDSDIRLARLTQWQELSENSYVGLGQRMFATGQDEYALMDIRQIKLDVVVEDSIPDVGTDMPIDIKLHG
ncbi:MAG: type VI secretion system accessory protein TagJ [Sedimenticola sp.]